MPDLDGFQVEAGYRDRIEIRCRKCLHGEVIGWSELAVSEVVDWCTAHQCVMS